MSDNTMKESNMGNYLIDVPDIGEGIAEVEIVEWNVNVGDTLEEDDVLCVVMTDKATVEIPSPIDGEITWQAAQAGEMIAVGAEFVRLQVAGEGNIYAVKQATTPTTAPTSKVVAAPEAKVNIAPTAKPVATTTVNTSVKTALVLGAVRAGGDKPIASPAVRQRARDIGIDLRYVRGTAPA